MEGKKVIALLGVVFGVVFVCFGLAILWGCGDFVTRDGAKAAGAILAVGGIICGLIGGLAALR